MSEFYLSDEELVALRQITRRTKVHALEWKRARYLILLHEGADMESICHAFEIGPSLGNKWR